MQHVQRLGLADGTALTERLYGIAPDVILESDENLCCALHEPVVVSDGLHRIGVQKLCFCDCIPLTVVRQSAAALLQAVNGIVY